MDMAMTPITNLSQYRVHILVFLLAGIAALTCAHPAFLVNDEWITANQLVQLNEGHQAIITEGNYGAFENGTWYPYFTERNGILGYSLLYPLVSLPAEWIVYLFGDQFTFVITYIWTFLLITLALVLNAFFPEYTHFRKWRWTSALIVLTFISFFLNLNYYTPFRLTSENSSPEILAIVFTNVLLFALLAVMVYEILRTIFRDLTLAFVGTVICLSCSSYFFWTTFCKDHVLIALLFSIILLLVIKFLITDNPPWLFGGFFMAGLLIWARPELGVFIFIALCIVILSLRFWLPAALSSQDPLLLISPVFTLLGAIPFFINNYLASKNLFIPSFVLSMNISSSSYGIQETSAALLQADQLTSVTPLSSFPADLIGILFAPQSGSMGILVIVPLFLAAIVVVPFLMKKDAGMFDEKEMVVISMLLLFSLAVFGAYINRAYGLNIDLGIMPDIRYLSPIYLPLTITGLMVFKKAPGIMDKPLDLLTGMVGVWLILIPLSLALIFRYYPDPMEWKYIFPLLNHWTTLCIFIVTLVFVLMYAVPVRNMRFAFLAKFAKIFFAFMCALPLVWQVDASFLTCLFAGGFGGYLFWLPGLLKLLNIVI